MVDVGVFLTEASIEAAFAAAQRPGDEEIVSHDECEECDSLRASLAGKHWRDLGRMAVDQMSQALPLLSPAAFRYFLPAVLIRGLREHDKSTDPLVLSFGTAASNEDSDSFWQVRLDLLSEAEAEMVAGHVRRRHETDDGREVFPLPLSAQAHEWLQAYLRERKMTAE